MMERRQFLGASALAGAGLGLAAAGPAAAADGKAKPALRDRPARRPLLINRARAETEMTRAGLDGMIVRDPSNVYYATNHWSIYTDYGSQQPSYAVIPRRADQPVIAVVPWVELWKLAEDDAELGPMIVFDARAGKTPRPTSFNNAPVAPGVELGVVEKTFLEASETYMADAAPDAMAGLVKALKQLGLGSGRIGVDDARIQIDLGEAGIEGPELVRATPMMYRIRQVKTPAEIALLRRAAQTSADCAIAAVHSLDAGATLADLRALFRAEAGKRGAGYINIAAGGPDLANHRVERGKPFMIDAVATVDRYCGDFGRTVVLGEPTAKVTRITRRAAAAWEGVYAQMRPGLRFSEVRGLALAAAVKAGFEVSNLGIGAHSVGLQHSEDPIEKGGMEDFVMQPGMVISVDHPATEWGWGTTHLEDLSVITADGVEPLNTHSDALIVI